jgi:TPP-dependent pyruvate/acetoin dehydrogenase alpha subunit
VLTDEFAEEARVEAADLMRAGIAAAEAEPPPDPSLLFDVTFVDPPAHYATDLAELRRILGTQDGSS